ncbi:hypothetical protein [Marinicella meishanensis]|uniref:hypothetical protein n=1 Tax=Marinicella meishanensis TaxID=2873263 RepID=UPI001CC0F2FE|nr:hypothetical protein [Marinicella sp. NBU2979]
MIIQKPIFGNDCRCACATVLHNNPTALESDSFYPKSVGGGGVGIDLDAISHTEGRLISRTGNQRNHLVGKNVFVDQGIGANFDELACWTAIDARL